MRPDTPEVAGEMRHLKAPQLVRDFVAAPPTWLRIQSATVPRSFPELDPGESAAINLAIELRATLMIDEADGRATAIASGLKIIGVVGILERAGNQGIIPDLKRLHDQIRSMPFHISDVILADSLARHLASRRT